MKNKKDDKVGCPHCGAEISRNAKSCPECGSDEKTGWSDQTYMDEIDIGMDESEYEDLKSKEFGGERSTKKISWQMIVAGIVLIAFIVGILSQI